MPLNIFWNSFFILGNFVNFSHVCGINQKKYASGFISWLFVFFYCGVKNIACIKNMKQNSSWNFAYLKTFFPSFNRIMDGMWDSPKRNLKAQIFKLVIRARTFLLRTSQARSLKVQVNNENHSSSTSSLIHFPLLFPIINIWKVRKQKQTAEEKAQFPSTPHRSCKLPCLLLHVTRQPDEKEGLEKKGLNWDHKREIKWIKSLCFVIVIIIMSSRWVREKWEKCELRKERQKHFQTIKKKK